MPRRWTHAEDAALLCRHEQGQTHRQIAAALGRRRDSVRYRLQALGVAPRPAHRRWTPEQEQALVEGISAGMTHQQVAAQLDRTVDSVRNRCRALGIRTQEITWTRARLDELERWLAQGLGYAAVAERMGCTRGAVMGAAQRIGVGTARGMAWQRMPEARRARLHKLIIHCIEDRGMTQRGTTEHLNAIGERISLSWVNRELQSMEPRIRRIARENASRRRSLLISVARRKQEARRRAA